ncbi:hypothetical protein BYT27DRAFT_7208049 [Phlegmacium glaucopus]|nr:hypothetical protein BYT27DRAFT_7208049 [Phlegmacium glaucopus]
MATPENVWLSMSRGDLFKQWLGISVSSSILFDVKSRTTSRAWTTSIVNRSLRSSKLSGFSKVVFVVTHAHEGPHQGWSKVVERQDRQAANKSNQGRKDPGDDMGEIQNRDDNGLEFHLTSRISG